MSDNTPLRKKNTGEPGNGGEFGHNSRSDAPEGLLDGPAPLNETFTLRKGRGNGVFTVDNDQTDPPAVRDGAFMRKTLHLGGQRHVNARAKAIAALGYPESVREDADKRAEEIRAAGQKMTVLSIGERGRVEVREGTAITYQLKTMLLSKGSTTKGHLISDLHVADVLPGYGKGQKLVDEYNSRAALVPVLTEATVDGIPEESADGEPIDDIAAVYMMDSADFGEGSTPGCLFLATDVQPGETAEDTVVNGYFWAPEGGTVFSEHGSFYQTDLANRGGRVRDYEPNALTFSGVMSGELGSNLRSAYTRLSEVSTGA